jgi:hypothetical protein
MRANVPVDDETVIRPVVDDTEPIHKVNKEQLELAKLGNNPDWKILEKYILARIDIYKNGLFGENLSAQSTDIIGQRFLAAQSVVAEFQSLIDQIQQTTEIVNEAAKESGKSVRPE